MASIGTNHDYLKIYQSTGFQNLIGNYKKEKLINLIILLLTLMEIKFIS